MPRLDMTFVLFRHNKLTPMPEWRSILNWGLSPKPRNSKQSRLGNPFFHKVQGNLFAGISSTLANELSVPLEFECADVVGWKHKVFRLFVWVFPHVRLPLVAIYII